MFFSGLGSFVGVFRPIRHQEHPVLTPVPHFEGPLYMDEAQVECVLH